MKRTHTLSALLIGAAALIAVPAASAACDISETKCAKNGGKCNIKFRNVTAAEKGSGGGTELTQSSSAQMVKVKAIKENGNKAGNALTIDSSASKTMNIDKKANKNFAKIRITSPSMARVEGVTMSCADVQNVLDGSGTCKVFHGYGPYGNESFEYQLGYNCDGGNTSGPG